MTVQRWDTDPDGGLQRAYEGEQGDYVSAADYDALAARLAEADWLLQNLPHRDDDAQEQAEWGERLRAYLRAAGRADPREFAT